MTPRRLLLATDLSKNSERAATLALNLASTLESEIEVIHVLEPILSIDSSLYNLDTIGPDLDSQRLERARHQLDQWIAALNPSAGLKIDSNVATGVPQETIVDRAKEGQHDWVVVGTHGRTGLVRTLLGSVAEKVVRNTDRPVLTIGQEDKVTFPFRRILVPVDILAERCFGVDHAVDLARALGAKLEFLYTWHDPEEFGVRMWEYLPGVSKEEFYAVADESVTRKLQQFVEPFLGPDDVTTVTVLRGSAPEVIRRHAESQSCDLIVVGAHNRSKVGRALFGSVSDRVIRTSEVPVLVIHE